jgi:hypothetical protein
MHSFLFALFVCILTVTNRYTPAYKRAPGEAPGVTQRMRNCFKYVYVHARTRARAHKHTHSLTHSLTGKWCSVHSGLRSTSATQSVLLMSSDNGMSPFDCVCQRVSFISLRRNANYQTKQQKRIDDSAAVAAGNFTVEQFNRVGTACFFCFICMCDTRAASLVCGSIKRASSTSVRRITSPPCYAA